MIDTHNTIRSSKIKLNSSALIERARRIFTREARIVAGERGRQFCKIRIAQAVRETLRNPNEIRNSRPVSGFVKDAASLVCSPSTPTSSPSSTKLSPSQITEQLNHIRAIRKTLCTDAARKSRETKWKKREQAERRLAPVWARATEAQRMPAYEAAILEHGSAVLFTVNFSPKVLEAAGRARSGAFHNLRSRISRNLKDAADEAPELFCGLDTTATGRLHIHGAVIWRSGDLQALAKALLKASGVKADAPGAAYQVQLQGHQLQLISQKISQVVEPLTPGYGSYAIKHVKALKVETNHSALYASNDLKKRAETIYSEDRDRRKALLSINTDFDASDTLEMPLVSESKDDSYASAEFVGRDYDYEAADCFSGILRRPVSGHGIRHRLTGREAYRPRPAPGSWAPELRYGRSDQRRRLAPASRSRCPLRAPAGRAYSARARGLGVRRRSLATGPP